MQLTVRDDPGPRDGEPVRVQVHVPDQLDVIGVLVVGVASNLDNKIR